MNSGGTEENSDGRQKKEQFYSVFLVDKLQKLLAHMTYLLW